MLVEQSVLSSSGRWAGEKLEQVRAQMLMIERHHVAIVFRTH